LSASTATHSSPSAAGLGAIIVLFGLLAFAGHANELLKQLVIAPGSAAELAISPDCRADELEEEDISELECLLLVSNVQIQLASSPEWFRPFQLATASAGSLLSLLSLFVGFALIKSRQESLKTGVICIGLLLALDVLGFIAATGTGPLLRTLYLWPLLLWFFIHLCMLLAIWRVAFGNNHDHQN